MRFLFSSGTDRRLCHSTVDIPRRGWPHARSFSRNLSDRFGLSCLNPDLAEVDFRYGSGRSKPVPVLPPRHSLAPPDGAFLAREVLPVHGANLRFRRVLAASQSAFRRPSPLVRAPVRAIRRARHSANFEKRLRKDAPVPARRLMPSTPSQSSPIPIANLRSRACNSCCLPAISAVSSGSLPQRL